MNEHIVIVTGSASIPIPTSVVDIVPPTAIVLGADGGFDRAVAAGLRPNGLIGDLDSVSDDGLAWAEKHATISRHPVDKSETDTELALKFAADMSPARLTMIGAGDRLDHMIAAIGALGARTLTGVPEIDAWWGDTHVDVVHGPGSRRLELEPGSLMSVLVFGRTAEKVTLEGTRWPLDEAGLAPVVGLGLSNEVTDPDGIVTVSLSSGVLTVFDTPARPATDAEEQS